MTFAADFAQNLKLQADIVRVVGEYVSLRKSGAQNYSGLCPFHKEKTPSFSVHATKQFYYCFGCGEKGDVFKFVQKIENVTFPEAVRAVAQKIGVALPKATFSSEAEAKDARTRTALLDIHERACAFFQECLRRPEGARAREYLAGRGLDDDAIKKFRIGFAPDSGFLLRDRLKGQFSEEMLRESGLFSWKDSRQPSVISRQPNALTMYSKFRNRIMFPIANEGGRVIAFTGRTLSADEKAGPKYLNSPETAIYSKSRVLFNLDLAKEAIRALNYAILVEGQMDCISLFAAGFHNVIASSGTAFTGPQAGLLARFSKQVVVNFDPDAAGAKATERTLGLLIEEEFDIRVLTLEAGFDPDLFVRRKGKDAYKDALKHSQKYFEYLIERARMQFPVRSAEGKTKAVNYLLPHVQRVPSLIVRDALAEEIAQKLNLDSAVLRQELKHAANTRKTATVKTSAEAQVTDAERILIRALAAANQFQNEDSISDRSGEDDAFDPARQARYVLSADKLHVGLGTESL
ncbi:MAG: DNA primase, partial [Acidobacteria bacterium]